MQNPNTTRRPATAMGTTITAKGKERANVDNNVNVLDIAANRIGHDERLSEGDVYSILRALQKSGDDPRLHSFLAHAANFVHSTHIHLFYLKTLLSLRTLHHTSLLIRSLCEYLKFSPDFSRPFLDILWHVVYTRTSILTHQDKVCLLEMVHFRLNSDNPRTTTRVTQYTHIPTLAGALESAIFPVSASHIHSPDTRRWAAEQARLAFDPGLPWETRWENLLALAMYKAPPAHKVTPTHRSRDTNKDKPTYPESGSQSSRNEGTKESSGGSVNGRQRQEQHAPTRTTSTATDPSLSRDWRPVLILSSLEARFEEGVGNTGCSHNDDKRIKISRKIHVPPRITVITHEETRESVRDIVRSLWAMWKPHSSAIADVGVKEATVRRPLSVSRAIAAAFLRATARVADESLAEACLRACVERGLLLVGHSGGGGGTQDRGGEMEELFETQVADMYVPFVLALAASQGTSWQDVLDVFTPTPTTGTRSPASTTVKTTGGMFIIPHSNDPHLITTMLLHYFNSTQDAPSAYGAYTYASERRIYLPANAVNDLNVCLVRNGHWQLAVRVLEERMGLFLRYRSSRSPPLPLCRRQQQHLEKDQDLGRESDSEPEIVRELEPLLLPILRAFQFERYEYIESSHARVIVDALWMLYGSGSGSSSGTDATASGTNTGDMAQAIPGAHAKYPVRFVFCILIASGYAERAIEVVEAIHRRDRSLLGSFKSSLHLSESLPLSAPATSATARRRKTASTGTPPHPRPPQPFFTTRLLLRLMRTLVRHRHFTLTKRVLDLVPPKPVAAAEDFRRKLVMALTRAGEVRAAREVYGYVGTSDDSSDVGEKDECNTKKTRTREARRTARELMIKAVKFKTRHPPPRTTASISPMVLNMNSAKYKYKHKRWCVHQRSLLRTTTLLVEGCTDRHRRQHQDRHCSLLPQNSSTIRYACLLLTRAHRTYTALKLLRRCCAASAGAGEVDAKTRTDVGNMILHSYLERARWRNGRVVRRVLRMKEALESAGTGVGFRSDRVTVNILVKAVLRWKAVKSGEVRGMFDHLVRCGYPASERWKVDAGQSSGAKGVSSQPRGSVFGTLSSSFDVPIMHQPLSFERHVRPLYKMFVRAFHVRGDVEAAQMVWGILKEEEVMAVRTRERRNKARRWGLIRRKRVIDF